MYKISECLQYISVAHSTLLLKVPGSHFLSNLLKDGGFYFLMKISVFLLMSATLIFLQYILLHFPSSYQEKLYIFLDFLTQFISMFPFDACAFHFVEIQPVQCFYLQDGLEFKLDFETDMIRS